MTLCRHAVRRLIETRSLYHTLHSSAHTPGMRDRSSHSPTQLAIVHCIIHSFLDQPIKSPKLEKTNQHGKGQDGVMRYFPCIQ